MTATNALNAGLVPRNHYVVCDPTGRVVRICQAIYSFAAITFQEQNGRLVRVC